MSSSTPAREKQTAPAPQKSAAPAPQTRGNLWHDLPLSLSRMQEEFNRLFARWHREWPALGEGLGHGWKWDVNMIDQDRNYVLRAEAPGFELEDFDIHLEGNRLVLKAVHKTAKGKKDEPSEVQEREYYYAMTLPGGVDRENVGAVYKNGVLSVILPKTEEVKARKVPVKHG